MPPFMAGTSYSQFLEQVRVPSITCAHLADEFAKGKRKLAPVIISHAEFTSGFQYQYCAQELASHGYMVLIPDHAMCGSASHTEFENCEATSYDPRLRLQEAVKPAFIGALDQQEQPLEWHTLVEKRKEELGVLVDEVLSPGFILKVLIFGIEAELDASKLTIIGHKVGAVAAKNLAS